MVTKHHAPRFIVDVNVGRLAKWLRTLGYDTLFINHIDDDTLVRIGLQENRVVLTRDARLMERRVVTTGQLKVLPIREDYFLAQLKQVVEELGLDSLGQRLSLCLECNVTLHPVPKAQAERAVPPYVFKTQSFFWLCPSCQRVYWQGTHWQRIRQQLDQWLRVEVST